MRRPVPIAVPVAVVVALALAACAGARRPIEQRTTQGPTALDFFVSQSMVNNGREPSFEERRHWDARLEQRISTYLREHPEVANSLDVSTFRFERRVAVGMAKEQVRILLGPPVASTTDPAGMEKLARRYWPAIKEEQVGEVWTYLGGWHLYFAGDRLADITQYFER